MKEKGERTCPTCAIKATCLERTMMLHYMFIATGRSDELTDEVKEKFGFKGDCKNWVEKTESFAENENHRHCL